MSIRLLATLLASCLIAGCSFDRMFFPVDDRPGEISRTNQENIVLRSADGNDIHHVLIKPHAEFKATIFVFHGSGSSVSNWTKLLEPLVMDGYQVFLMEYRGFGNSEGAASHRKVARDAESAFVYLVDREDVHDRPLLVLGQSYGAQLAIYLAARFPDQIDALIMEGAFTSFQDIAVYSTPWIAKPFTWAFFMNPYNSVSLIRKATMPKLIIHSDEDGIVPFFMGQELFARAEGAKEFWHVQGEHVAALLDYPDEFVARLNRVAGLVSD